MKMKSVYAVIGMVVAIASIVVGIVFIDKPVKYSTISEGVRVCEYGADYYTDQYAVTRAAALNVRTLNENIKKDGRRNAIYVGSFFIVYGIALFLKSGEKLELAKEEKNRQTSSVFQNSYGNTNNRPIQYSASVAGTNAFNTDAEPIETALSMEDAEKEIRIYIEQFDNGAISETEFLRKKDEILSRVKE